MKDLISRQAAIDAIVNTVSEIGLHDNSEVARYGATFRQHEIIDIIEGMPSAQPEQRWIPCSERLPEHGGRYLISVLDGINRRTTVAPYLPRCKAWAMNGRMAYWKVIAWLPLPEPYKEVE